MKLGQMQELKVVKEVDFGVYLGTSEERILLPRKQVPKETKIGDELEVFIYKDSQDRLIATTNVPLLRVGEISILEVKEVGAIGAFLDWGLEKDLLLPFREQTEKVEVGDKCLVTLYVDKSERLCATMRIYEYLRTDSPYQKDDWVEGFVFDFNKELGYFVAVDNLYSGLIRKIEVYGKLQIGMEVKVRVVRAREDGRLDLSMRDKAHLQMNDDAKLILEALEARGGILPFNDRADPKVIKDEMQMSKNAFKRAVGRLLKEGKIDILEKTIAIRKK